MTWPASLAPLLFIAPVLVIALAVQARPRGLAASVERLARRVNLALDDDVRGEVMTFQRRRVLASGVGAIAGLAVALALAPADSPARGAALVLCIFGGGAVGVAAAALGHARRATGAAREATAGRAVTGRLLPVAIDDLVPAGERIGMRIALAVGGALSLGAIGAVAALEGLEAIDPRVLAGAAVFLGIGVVSAAAWEAVAGRIASSRPIAGGAQALAWSDALRSQTLRDMVVLPLTAALYAPLTLLTEIVLAAPAPLDSALGAALGLLALAAFIAAIVVAVLQSSPGSPRNPAQHYQRRLWPELAGGGR